MELERRTGLAETPSSADAMQAPARARNRGEIAVESTSVPFSNDLTKPSRFVAGSPRILCDGGGNTGPVNAPAPRTMRDAQE
jgi:hypothetical protein